MEAIGNIGSLLLLGWMSLQDFRTRSIQVWLLPAIILCMLLAVWPAQETGRALLSNFMVNAALLGIQFFLLWCVVSLRNRRWIKLVNTQIGLGDILLLVVLAPFFSPLNFFVFYVFGLVFALCVTLLVRSVHPQRWREIPLAGLLGLPLMVLCTLRLFYPDVISFTSDEWLLLL